MDLAGMFPGLSVSASGLGAERTRMETIAKNIANANVVADANGTPYQRQEVVFRTVLDAAHQDLEGGVEVADVVADDHTPAREVFQPGHPMANKDGMVTYSNVDMANEMVDMLTASRAYEANLRAMRVYKDMVGEAMRLLEG